MTHSYPDVQLLINGNWQKARSGKTIPVLDPATDEQIGTVAWAGKEDLDLALEAAAEAFKSCSRVSSYERCKIMRKAAALLRERADSIGWMMTREQGKPLAQARMEVLGAADTIDWFAEEGRRAYGQVIPPRTP